MFIGDSITAQQYYSFICKVGSTIDNAATKKARAWFLSHKASAPKHKENPFKGQYLERGKQNEIFQLQHGGAKALFVASDFLVNINETTGEMNVPKKGTYVSDKCWDSKPDRGSGGWPLLVRSGAASRDDVVVINTGQHWQPKRVFSCMDGDWPSDTMSEMVEKEYTRMVHTVLKWFKTSGFGK